MDIEGNELLAIFYVFGMAAGMFVIFLAMKQRSESLEREHRERMAMIERGHVPPTPAPERRGPPTLSMSLGIIIVGLGLALMTIIGIAAGEVGVGVGIGGAIVIVGAAFIVRSMIVRPAESSVFSAAVPPPPPPPVVRPRIDEGP